MKMDRDLRHENLKEVASKKKNIEKTEVNFAMN